MKKTLIGIGILSIIIIFISTQLNKEIKISESSSEIKSNTPIKQDLHTSPKLSPPKKIVSIKTQIPSKETIQAKKELEDLKIQKVFEERKKAYMEDFKKKNQIINIENHFVDKEKGLIQPYKEINEDDVGWPPTELPHFNDPIQPVNYHYPVELLNFKDIMLGVENGFIKEFKLKTANQEGSMVYSNCKKQESQYNLFILCYNGADGYLNLVMEKTSKNITGNFSYFGRNEIIKTKNGKGYIYGVYK